MALDFTGLSQDEVFAKASQYAGVPEGVARGQWMQESTNGTRLTSPAGARGHFHSMPATTATWQQRTGKTYNVDDFNQAAELWAHTMKENMQLAGGDVTRALRIYHGGTNEKNWGPINAAYAGAVFKHGGLDGGESMGISGRAVANEGDAWEGKRRFGQADEALFESAWKGDPIPRADDIKGAKGVREHLSQFEKAGIRQHTTQAATQLGLRGADIVAVAESAQEVARQDTKAAVAELQMAGSLNAPVSTDDEAFRKDRDKAITDAIEREEWARSLTFGDKWGAHFGNTLTAGAMRMWYNEADTTYPEGWRYIDHADEYEKDKTYEEVMRMREAISPEDAERIDLEIIQLRQDQKIMGTLGTGANLMYGGLASISDPLGWAAGVGIGKAASLLGVGSRAYIAAGRPIAALASGAGEGAVGNLLTSATLDAMGDYRTPYDHLEDMGMGLIFGGALALPGARNARINQLGNQMITHAASQKVALGVKAQGAAGPNANPSQLKAAMQQVVMDEETATRQAVLGDIPDSDRLFARPDVTPVRPAAGEPELPVQSVFKNKKQRGALEDVYGLRDKITDDATRIQVAEAVGRATNWAKRADVDEKLTTTVLAKADLEATSSTLVTDNSVVSKWVGINILENPEGAGGRVSTAALTKSQLNETYLGTSRVDMEQHYNMWSKERGVGVLHSALWNDQRKLFYKEVAREIDRRLNKHAAVNGVHPSVAAAADSVHGMYKRAGSDMIHVGVAGADNIDVNMPYFQRAWDLGTIRNMEHDLPRRNAFLSMLEDQFQSVAGYGDDKFLKALSRTYLERLEHRAMGLVDTPANVYNDGTADILRDSLKALRLNEEQINEALKRFQRGAPGMTKSRIDMDLNKSYPDGAGGSFTALDFLDTDLPKLMRNYAGRASGEVALYRHGIPGEAGMKTTRLAMRATGASDRALEAFDQVTAEMLGRNFGKGDNKYLANARLMVSAVRLGGAVFPQLGLYLDAAMGLGATRSLRALTDAPRLHKEIRQMLKGEKVDGILSSLEETGAGQFGMSDYRMFGMFDSPDMTEVYGRESLGAVSQAVRGTANAVRILSGHRALVGVQTRGMAEQITYKAWKYIRSGDAQYDKALADMGFNAQHLGELRRVMDDVATFDANGNLKTLDFRKLKADDVLGRKAANNFRDSVVRGASQILNKEFIGETGKWAHNGYLKVLFQFRTFSLTAHQKQLGRNLNVHGNKALLGYVVGAMSVAAPIHLARSALRAALLPEDQREEYMKQQMHPLMLGRAAMNYISTLGLLPDVLEMGGSFGGGIADMAGMERPAWAAPTGGRGGAQSEFIGGTVAPAIGLANDAMQGLHGRPSQMIRSLPGNSLWWAQPLWLGGEAQLKED